MNYNIGDSISEAISNYAKLVCQEKEDDLVKFLEAKGFHPKKTTKYMKSLKRRLAKKGLELICTIDERIPPVSGDGCEIIININWQFNIVPLKGEPK